MGVGVGVGGGEQKRGFILHVYYGLKLVFRYFLGDTVHIRVQY